VPPDRHTKILLDAPPAEPKLSFPRTAAALAQVVQDSSPRFSVGIFGEWGSGKTTLMHAIRRALLPTIATVGFNAWRFEREPQLLVPLLDTVRTALVDWSVDRDTTTRERVERVAPRVGRVVRALVSGLSDEIGLSRATVVYDAAAAAWIGKSRRCVRDYETLPTHHEAMVHITMIMSRRLARSGDW